uniref:LOW QUALITY PROTEIN: nuclear factor erythroid 2-related factor 3 n=1 Tax=Phascolarctos cinereus TaxID=38626 RepID=A0A6P5KVX9_PHACI|nr:LOW QUALITY PROTEIN: nuclear factor erythroid 2-related factor 3 [Phascolarctos cinereus]
MMYLKPSWAQGCGGLLHLAVLLSLAGLRMDLDLYLLLPPPPPLLRDPWTLLGSPGGAAYALPSFQEGAVGGWGQGHPKRPDTDSALSSEGQRLLQEVRTLGVPFIPRTHVDAWLVHCVASAGGAGGPPRLLGNAAPTEASGTRALETLEAIAAVVAAGRPKVKTRTGRLRKRSPPTAAPASGGVETSGCGVEESSGDEMDTAWSLEDVFHLMAPPVENSLEDEETEGQRGWSQTQQQAQDLDRPGPAGPFSLWLMSSEGLAVLVLRGERSAGGQSRDGCSQEQDQPPATLWERDGRIFSHYLSCRAGQVQRGGPGAEARTEASFMSGAGHGMNLLKVAERMCCLSPFVTRCGGHALPCPGLRFLIRYKDTEFIARQGPSSVQVHRPCSHGLGKHSLWNGRSCDCDTGQGGHGAPDKATRGILTCGISSRPLPLLCNSSSDGVDGPGQYSVNFSQAISHDVSLHEAMLACPDTCRRDTTARHPQTQDAFLPLNSSNALPFPGMDWAGFSPSTESRTRNLTTQDLLLDLDENIFDEINLISFAMEEGFDPMEVSQLFEEPDSDSGLSLDSSHSSTSVTNLNSSASPWDGEGAVGYSSDAESLSHQGLEGAVGGHWPETSELCYMSDSEPSGEPTLEHILHNHTYYLLPSPPSSEPLLPCPQKSQTVKRSGDLNDRDIALGQDKHHAKTLCLPFSVDEIVSMPVDSFNSVLAKSFLTDTQVSLLRDIRRRGKNKVAAQNCRKRKLDGILSLEKDVGDLRAQRESLQLERAQYSKSLHLMKQKLHSLYRDVFSRLRDDQGRPVNPNLYALHCGQDGSVLIVPKELMTSGLKKDNQKEKERK